MFLLALEGSLHLGVNFGLFSEELLHLDVHDSDDDIFLAIIINLPSFTLIIKFFPRGFGVLGFWGFV